MGARGRGRGGAPGGGGAGPRGGGGPPFPQLVVYVAEGYPPNAAFRSLYGAPEAADAAFAQYVKSF